MADSHRTARVADRLREELARLIQHDLRDPRVAGVLISRVDVTGDLQLATIFIRLSPDPGRPEPDEHAQKQALAGLKAASGRLRTLAAQALKMRRAIELRFAYDSGLDASTRVEALLDEIKRDEKG